ncbi:MAG: GNAT family N-acetyltransferase [Pontixanthobacter sp.]
MDDDVDRIMAIMDRAFDPVWGEAWNRRQIMDSMMMPNIHYNLLAGRGFTLVRAAPGEEELLLVAVDPNARGQGVGRRLVERAAQDARGRGADAMYLEMRANNPAERLYRAMGFEPIGRRTDYYRGPGSSRIDAISFRLTL